jgi:hypothetical protein
VEMCWLAAVSLRLGLEGGVVWQRCPWRCVGHSAVIGRKAAAARTAVLGIQVGQSRVEGGRTETPPAYQIAMSILRVA